MLNDADLSVEKIKSVYVGPSDFFFQKNRRLQSVSNWWKESVRSSVGAEA